MENQKGDDDDVRPSPAPAPQANDDMNLVPRYEKFKLCKLCYRECPTEEGMKIHMEVVHRDHEERHLDHISLKDLVIPCQWCPGVKFLSESIMITHAKINHNKVVI